MIQRKLNQIKNYWSLQFDLYRTYILGLPPKVESGFLDSGETRLTDGRTFIAYGRATAGRRREASGQPSPSIND